MDDLKERLRFEAEYLENCDDKGSAPDYLREAADRIAALEAQLAAVTAALNEAIVWDSHDDEGIPAVWLDMALGAIAPHTNKGDGA